MIDSPGWRLFGSVVLLVAGTMIAIRADRSKTLNGTSLLAFVGITLVCFGGSTGFVNLAQTLGGFAK